MKCYCHTSVQFQTDPAVAQHLFWESHIRTGIWTLFTVLFKLPTAAISLPALLPLCEPPAACLGHSDEDDEEEAHSPDACYRQHHRRQYA